jgi:hypothetical protein
MAITRNDYKTEVRVYLQACGGWDWYLNRRAVLVLPDGSNRKAAYDQAFDEAVEKFSGNGNDGPEVTANLSDKEPNVLPLPEKPTRRRKKVTSKDFAGKPTASVREIVEWVFENYALRDILPESAPSAGAWALLQTCWNNDVFWLDFLRNIWPKLIPTKKELDIIEKRKDDGRETLSLISAVETELERLEEESEE